MIKAISNTLTGFEVWLQNYNFPEKNSVWFRRCVYGLMLVKMLFMWPGLHIFYRHRAAQHFSHKYPDAIYFTSLLHGYYNIVWIAAMLLLAWVTFGKKKLWLSVLVFIIAINYLNLLWPVFNNADKLMRTFTFALIFVTEGAKQGSVKKLLNNSVFFLLKVFFSLLYFFNSYCKMIEPIWQDGSCMQDVWQLAYFANTGIIPGWFLNPVVAFVTAWGAMLFEMSFALLIWFRPLRKWLLIIGVLFHVLIALLLSLPDFSLTILVAYILFIDPKQKKVAVAVS